MKLRQNQKKDIGSDLGCVYYLKVYRAQDATNILLLLQKDKEDRADTLNTSCPLGARSMEV